MSRKTFGEGVTVFTIPQKMLRKTSSYITPGIPTTITTMGVNITTIAYLRVFQCFNHRNWVNHYFHGGGSPGLPQLIISSYLICKPSILGRLPLPEPCCPRCFFSCRCRCLRGCHAVRLFQSQSLQFRPFDSQVSIKRNIAKRLPNQKKSALNENIHLKKQLNKHMFSPPK